MMNAGDDDDAVEALRARFEDGEMAVPKSRIGRLWRTGRTAAGMASAVLGGRLRDRDQLTSADLAAIAKLTARLGELKGITMKIGQIFGYIDVTLPSELRGLLSLLQTQAPASPWTSIETTIRAAFPDRAEALLAGLDRKPIAVASIGQVHHGVLPDGTEVAVKVRHPGIEQAIRADFGNAAVGALFARMMPGGASVRGALDEVRTRLLEECDFSLEAARQAQIGTWFANHPSIVIPEPLPSWCAPAILATRWTPGRSLDDFVASDPPQVTRDRVGTALFELFVGTLYRHGVFHADPHPGNFAIRDDERVVIYDFGCVREFASSTVTALTALVAAVRSDDVQAIDHAMRALGAVPPTKPKRREQMRTLLRGFFAPLLVDGPHLVDAGAGFAAEQLFRDKRALIGLSLPSSLLFLLRLRFGLYAVLARLGTVADWSALEARFVAERLGAQG